MSNLAEGLLEFAGSILIIALFLSLGSQNWLRGFWASLVAVGWLVLTLIVLVVVMVFTGEFIGDNHPGILLGVGFGVFGISMVLSIQRGEDWIKHISPPRLLTIRDSLSTVQQRKRFIKVFGIFLMVIGFLLAILDPFLKFPDVNILVDRLILTTLYAGAIVIIVVSFYSSLRMNIMYPRIASMAQNDLMALLPPLLWGIRVESWQEFKRYLSHRIEITWRVALASVLPERRIQKIILVGMLMFFIWNSVSIIDHPIIPRIFVEPHTTYLLIIWASAFVTGFVAGRTNRRYIVRLQERVHELDPS